MSHIFYFFAVIALLWELQVLLNPKKVHVFVTGMKDLKYDAMSSTQKSFMFLALGYIVWSLVGIFSSQWLIFLLLFAIGRIPKKWVWLRWLDSFISLLGIVFLILNAYHFHLDLFGLLKSLIS